jgi:hypothetical protein
LGCFRIAGGAGSSDAELRPATGVARSLERLGHDQEQKPHHVGDGGVVFGRKVAGLAVELGIDGYGYVSYFSHGAPEVRDQRSEIRDQRSEIRDQRSGIRDQRSEIRDQRSEIRDQRSEIRDQRSEIN